MKKKQRKVKYPTEMVEDTHRLCKDCVLFRLKWGIPLKVVVDFDYKEPKG